MQRKIILIITIIFLFYFLSYVFVRQTNSEVWDRDGNSYVILPENKFLYYFYRPLSILDKSITGRNTHIGKHK